MTDGVKLTAEPIDFEYPQVSVIVAIYNGAGTLRACLDSLLRLDYPRGQVELICVDNASSDDTPRILHAYRDRLRIVHQPKRGPAAARNAGVRCATGTVIALTDADCVVDPHWLRHLVRPLCDTGVGVAGGTILSKRPCNSIEAFGEQIHDHYRALHEFKPPYAITMNWAARTDVLGSVGLFNEDLLRCSDVDWSYRMLRCGYRGVYAPAAVVYHQNEHTPWGLMHEGYVHGYHAVRVSRLHTALLHHARLEKPATPPSPPTSTTEPCRLTPKPRRDQLWLRLFQFGKRVGRLHASLSSPLH